MKLADMMQLALKNGYSFEELKQLKEWEREELAKGGDEGEGNEEGGDEPEKKDSNIVENNEQKQIEELTKQVENLKSELKKAQDTNKRGSSESLETESAFERMMKKASR